MEIYTDGSFYKKIPIWAFVVVNNNKRVHSDSGTLGGDIVKMQQIGGELYAVIQAIEWAKAHNTRVWIVHDYEGVYWWVADIWGQKPWMTKNRWTQDYAAYVWKNRQYVIGMKSVRSHTGVHWNEFVDKEARKTVDAAGLINHKVW